MKIIRGITIPELMLAITIVSFILTLIVQFIIFYNQLKKGMEINYQSINQAKLLSEKINLVIGKMDDNNSYFRMQNHNNKIIIKKCFGNNVTFSAIGLYLNPQNNGNVKYIDCQVFINNSTKNYRFLSNVYPEVRIDNQGNVLNALLVVYANLYSGLIISKKSKVKKTTFGIFFINNVEIFN